MPLVPAVCTQCGGLLNVDSSTEAAICPHCKTPFVTETAINNYYTYHQSSYQIQHANIQMNDEKSVEKRLQNAEVFLVKHKDYKRADELFQEVAKDAPDDYRAWWGALRAQTGEFRLIDRYGNDYRYGDDYIDSGRSIDHYYIDLYSKAIQVAPDDIKGALTKTWEAFKSEAEYRIGLRNKLSNELSELEKIKDKLLSEKTYAERRVEECQKEMKRAGNEGAIITGIPGLLIILLGIYFVSKGALLFPWICFIFGGIFLFVSVALMTTKTKASAKNHLVNAIHALQQLELEIADSKVKIDSLNQEVKNIKYIN